MKSLAARLTARLTTLHVAAFSLAVFSLTASAQQPTAAAQPTPEQIKQMQAVMQRQMQVMAVMFDVKPSKLGYAETISAIKAGATKRGWPVGETQDMQAKMQQSGMKDAKRMTVIPTCPAQANEKIAKTSAGKAPALPCRVTVFEGKDSKIYLVRMNTSNMAKLVPEANIAKLMTEIGAEEDGLYREILQ
jgi:uncharacterized protein (DUF302 family)